MFYLLPLEELSKAKFSSLVFAFFINHFFMCWLLSFLFLFYFCIFKSLVLVVVMMMTMTVLLGRQKMNFILYLIKRLKMFYFSSLLLRFNWNCRIAAMKKRIKKDLLAVFSSIIWYFILLAFSSKVLFLLRFLLNNISKLEEAKCVLLLAVVVVTETVNGSWKQ